jgi:putative tricarboxylic transport membrane protein
MLLGIVPGPALFTFHPDVVWGLIASMYIGNVMLVILNLPLIGVFVQILRLPYAVMALFIVILSTLGVYSMTGDMFTLWLLLFFGVVGYVMRKLDFPLAPMLLGAVLGDMTETNFRESLSLSEGSWMIFLQRPISLAFLIILVGALIFQIVMIIRQGAYRSYESDDA